MVRPLDRCVVRGESARGLRGSGKPGAAMIDHVLLLYAIIILSYTPLGLYQMFLVARSVILLRGLEEKQYPKLDVKNKLVVAITTNGNATDVVEKIIATTMGYGLDLRMYVIKEESDTFRYSCQEIVVPKDYQCAHGSRNKMRALQYGIEWMGGNGLGKETYICHLDDDSMVSKEYLEYVIDSMTEEGGQGSIRLREFGRSLFSSLADIVRISNCEAWCKHFNIWDRPKFVHGEGLVVRADVEKEIGWDFGTYGAEDLMMGLEISRRYRFGLMPQGNIWIAPPTSVRDFFKQRRRWFWSIFRNEGKVRGLSLKVYLMYVYLYIAGVTGIIGFLILPYTIIFAPALTPHLAPFWIINTACFYIYYQYGASYHGSLRVSALLLFLQLPVAFYEGLTIIYSLVTRPDFNTFETIKKV